MEHLNKKYMYKLYFDNLLKYNKIEENENFVF